MSASRLAKLGRNHPCPCGSGRKAKRCCAIERGPSQESLARAYLSQAARAALLEIGPVGALADDLEAAAVRAGVTRTPGGLLLAA